MPRRAADLTGRRFGRLTVVERDWASSDGHATMWWTRCDCGGQGPKRAGALTSGATRSCGCLLRETAAQLWKRRRAAL
jgi:hypothetical protein